MSVQSDLQVRDSTTGYDAVDVLHNVSIVARQGEITCILGANGAGKSTLVRMIMGLTPARKGRIIFGGRDITRTRTHNLIKSGLSCIPEGRTVFPKFTVAQNLKSGIVWTGSIPYSQGWRIVKPSLPAPCPAANRP